MTPDRRAARRTADPSPDHGTRVNLTRARGERTREVILEEATLLFSTYGYRGTSLRDISERVGISHPGMLHHFSRKETLLQAVLERVARHFEELIDDFVETVQEPAAIRDWDAVRQYQSVMFAVVRAEAVEKDHPGHEAIVGMQTMAEEKSSPPSLRCTKKRAGSTKVRAPSGLPARPSRCGRGSSCAMPSWATASMTTTSRFSCACL